MAFRAELLAGVFRVMCAGVYPASLVRVSTQWFYYFVMNVFKIGSVVLKIASFEVICAMKIPHLGAG